MSSLAPVVALGDTISDRTTVAIREILAGRRRGLRAVLPLAGPAVVASVAYMDPGNVATNIQAGSACGYGLVWVVVLANAVAMLYQAMSAKLGIVTNSNVAELCRRHLPRPAVIAMWIVSEVAAMATDLAEFLGGAIGLSLLFRLPLLLGMVATAAVTYAILSIEKNGYRKIEMIVGGLVGVIGVCYLAELFIVPPDWSSAALHAVLPQLGGANALTLAVGIVGATVMPHAIYLHSGLTQDRAPARTDRERRQLLRFSNREVVVALSFAGLVNIAMVVMAAAAFHAGHSDVGQIETAYHTMVPLLGAGAAGIFLVSLMSSGISSSVVGTMAGQMIMQGFVGFRIPVWLRRLITIVPSFAVVFAGVNATNALVFSQVVLSLTLPVPMIALIALSRNRSLMGPFTAGRGTLAAASVATFVILALNVVLLLGLFGVPLPGFAAAT
jgi:manganese transport protein